MTRFVGASVVLILGIAGVTGAAVGEQASGSQPAGARP